MEPVLVLTTVPDADIARHIASALVAEKLAACVAVGGPVRSTYSWKGKVESTNELPVTIKTVRNRLPEVEARVRSLHPYEVPEFLVVPVVSGSPDYLAWMCDWCGV